MAITVGSVNDAPRGASSSVTIAQDSSYTFTVADFGFSDPGDVPANALLGVSISGVPGAGVLRNNGTAVSTGDFVSAADISGGRLTFQPGLHASGINYASLTFTVRDDGGTANGGINDDSVARTMAINVNAANVAPVVTDRALIFDGVNTTVVVAATPDLVLTNTGTIEFWIRPETVNGQPQIILNKEGEYEIAFGADGRLWLAFANASPGWTWTASSFAPTLNQWTHVAVSYNNGQIQIYADGLLVDSINGSGAIGDIYPGQENLTIGGRQNAATQRFIGAIDEVRIWNTVRSGAQVSANFDQTLLGNEAGLVGYWQFSETSGLIAIDSTASGNNGLLGAGVLANAPARSLVFDLNEDGSLVSGVPGVLTGATDANGNSLTAVLVSGPAHAALFSLNSDGSFVYVPVAGYNGLDSFVFEANDGLLNSRPATVNLRIAPVNDAPLGADRIVSALEDTQYVFNAAEFTFSDPNDSPANVLAGITVTSVPVVGSLTINGIAVAPGEFIPVADILAGGLVFLAAPDASGVNYSSFGFTVRDDGGTANGGLDEDLIFRTLQIDVGAVNDAPTISGLAGDSLAYVEGDGTVVIEQGVNALVADIDSSDFGGGSLTVSFVAGSNAAEDVLSIRNQGNGAGQIGVTGANLSFGGIQIGTFAGGSAGVPLVVNFNGSATPAAVSALLNNLSFTETNASNATLGIRTVRFVLNDGAGGTSNSHDAFVTVNGVNDVPVLTSAAMTVAEGQTTTLAAADFGILDPDSASFTFTLSAIAGGYFQLGSAPGIAVTSFNSAQLGGGLVQFVDDGNEAAPSFDVTVNDGFSNSNTLAAVINYFPANDVPVLNTATLSIVEGQTTTLTPGNFGVTDPDNLSFTFTASSVSGGYVQLSTAPGTPITLFTSAQLASGLVQFVDDGNEVAPSFDITVNDGLSNSNTLSAAIAYTPANDAPSLTAAALSVNEGQTVVLAMADFGIVDPDSASFTFTVSSVSGGFFQLSSAPGAPITSFGSAQLAGGLIQFVDDGNELPPGFDVTVNDGSSNSNTRSALISYSSVNDPPVVNAPAGISVAEDTPLIFSLGLGNAIVLADPDAGAGVIELSLSASNGSLSLARTNNLVFLVGTGFNDGQILVRGTLTDLNAAIDGLVYLPNLNFNGAAIINATLSDLGSTGSGASLSISRSIGVTVNPVNDAPIDLLRVPALAIAENSPPGTGAGTVVAVDPDDTGGFTFSLVDGAGHFTIDPVSGEIVVSGAALPGIAAQSSYPIIVRAIDSSGASVDRSFNIQVVQNSIVIVPPTSPEVGAPVNTVNNDNSDYHSVVWRSRGASFPGRRDPGPTGRDSGRRGSCGRAQTGLRHAVRDQGCGQRKVCPRPQCADAGRGDPTRR